MLRGPAGDGVELLSSLANHHVKNSGSLWAIVNAEGCSPDHEGVNEATHLGMELVGCHVIRVEGESTGIDFTPASNFRLEPLLETIGKINHSLRAELIPADCGEFALSICFDFY